VKRFHDEISHMLRQRRIACDARMSKTELGRFRKRKAFDCGHSKCPICHPDKFKRKPTRKEIMCDPTTE